MSRPAWPASAAKHQSKAEYGSTLPATVRDGGGARFGAEAVCGGRGPQHEFRGAAEHWRAHRFAGEAAGVRRGAWRDGTRGAAVRAAGHVYLFEFKVVEMAPPGSAPARSGNAATRPSGTGDR